METVEVLLRRVQDSLDYVTRSEGRALRVVRDLGPFILRQIRAAARLDPDPAARAILSALRELFEDYETLPLAGRGHRVTVAASLIRTLRGQASVWDMPVTALPYVGPVRAERLARLALTTIGAVLYALPWRYEDRARMTPIGRLVPGLEQTVSGAIQAMGLTRSPRRRLALVQVAVADQTGLVYATWFNQPYLKRIFEAARRRGDRVVLSGKVGHGYRGRGLEMEAPQYEVLGPEDAQLHTGRIVPIYHETEGVTVRQLRVLAHRALETYLPCVEEILPEPLRARLTLLPLRQALQEAHFPNPRTDLAALNGWATPAHRRLIFDECLLFQLGLAARKRLVMLERKAARFQAGGRLPQSLLARLPFTLTAAQRRVMREIAADLAGPHPMNRLLQGDVGSGKTIVALYAALIAIESGWQAAVMAPTEILAEQHLLSLQPFVGPLGVRTCLLTSGLKRAERRRRVEAVARGEVDLLIGTHALIEEDVRLQRLGLVVIDEQHKFGVIQRSALTRKGCPANVLVMTATPIPRTLAMSVYGDLDVSVLDELPPGRRPVETRLYPEGRRAEAYGLIAREVAKGRQAYVVYPLVEATARHDLRAATAMAKRLHDTVFPDLRIGLLHGRLSLAEKTGVMETFAAGRLDILVATSIVEVGVDVPNATVMVIEHAERFGLSQLHQLRGRVGRGAAPSSCLLLYGRAVTDEARRRLDAMRETTDGFLIAERDLAIRGPGEFFGTRQSGLPEFRLVDLQRDVEQMATARTVADDLVARDPDLTAPAHRQLRSASTRWWGGRPGIARAATP